MTTVFTAVKPTGHLQLGNYLGAVRPLVALAADPSRTTTVAVADLHALTVEHDPVALRERTVEMAGTLLACGLDPRATLFVQSHVPAHTELAYLLECVAAHGEMARMIQFREKSRGEGSVRLSLLTYPALMAADILVHRADLVPVGEDQRQHLELTTTLARRFNARYGETFVVPSALTPPTAARIKDLRDPTAKMGKSGAETSGVLFLRDSPDVVAAKVRRAVTDPDPVLTYDPARRPGVANLATVLAELTGGTPASALDGLHGSAALKDAVVEAVLAELGPVRVRIGELLDDRAELDRLLAAGRDRVAPAAAETVAAARAAMGLLPTPQPVQAVDATSFQKDSATV